MTTDLVTRAPCKHCGKDTDMELPDEVKEVMRAVKVKGQLIEKEDHKDNELRSELDVIKKKLEKTDNDEKPAKIERKLPPLSSYIPKFKCKDGNCEIGNHKNPNYSRTPKSKCSNCDQFNPHEKGKCLWCDSEDLEPLELEELEDLGIPMPSTTTTEHDHDHE